MIAIIWCTNQRINVMVRTDKPLARLKVVRRLSVDKGQVLQSGILDTSFSLCVLPLKDGLTQELKIIYSVVFESVLIWAICKRWRDICLCYVA